VCISLFNSMNVGACVGIMASCVTAWALLSGKRLKQICIDQSVERKDSLHAFWRPTHPNMSG
jgi:hypothetical protein